MTDRPQVGPHGPILVVDDDDSITTVVQMVLEDAGHRVLTAEDGLRALDVVKGDPPRLILLDMRMPRMNGWEFAEAYRASCAPCAPIVVITAATDAAQRVSEVGAQGYISKPFDISDLLQIVERHLPNGEV